MKVKVTGGGSIYLSILPLEEVKPHERTIPALLSALRRDMQRSGYQRDPILVDKDSHVALDGMHRRAALAAFKAKFALCAEFDYFDKSVKLERWLRYFIAPGKQTMADLKSIFHLRRCAGIKEAIKLVDSMENQIALLSSRHCYVSDDSDTTLKVYEKLGKFDRLCSKNRIAIEFVPEGDKFRLFSSESVYVLYPLPLAKSDVLGIAAEGKVLPFKTTRHIVPIRPMGVYFPLDLLCQSSYERCSKKLEEIVNLSKIRVEKRQVWYEGRLYSEPLAIFRK